MTADLVTDRLLLRPLSALDVEALVAFSATRTGGETAAPPRPADWADDYPDSGDLGIAGMLWRNPDQIGPFGHRKIVERASGLAVGGIGLFWPPVLGRVEIGYGIVPSRQGRGYATEATLAMLDFAFGLPEVDTVWADVERDNRASIRVLVKANFRHTATNGDLARFRLERP